ncbi:MAG TPA: lanthionine synthetase C family protein [Thermoanaerobaculia bacterium]
MSNPWHPLLAGSLADQASRALREIAGSLTTPERGEHGRSASLAGGLAGQALFYAYLALHTSEEAAADRAAELLDQAAEELANTPMPPSLYAGFAGVAWTMEHLRGRLFEAAGEEDDDPILEIDEALLSPLSRSPWPGEYDLIGGLSGLGVYALERLPRPTAAALLERIVDRLAETSEPIAGGTAWFTPPERLPEWQREFHGRGVYNLGVAHGLPGVVPVLAGAVAAGVAVDRARPLLDNSVRFLLSQRYDPVLGLSSCFGSTYAPWEGPSPSRLAWCYGDPGIAAALLATARAAGEPEWERQAIDIGLAAVSRDPSHSLIRDAGLCHGAAGLGHLFNRMFQETGEERLAEAARFWFERALELRVEGEGIAGFRAWEVNPSGEAGWRSDAGLLEGAAGVGLALLGALSTVEPAWDRTLLVSLPPVAETSTRRET